MTNVPEKISKHKLNWRLYNPPSPALCIVHKCTRPPLGATRPFCAEHQQIVDKLGKKHRPTTATYRRRLWGLVTTGKDPSA